MYGTHTGVLRVARTAGLLAFLMVLGGGAMLVVRHSAIAGVRKDAIPAAISKHLAGAPVRPAVVTDAPRWDDISAKLPLSFEANAGQTDARVRFLSRGAGYALFLTGNEAVLEFGKSHRPEPGSAKAPESHATIRLAFEGANPKAVVEGVGELPGKSNYFIGNRPENWRTGVANYERVRYHNLYPGIDLIFYGQGRQLEYDLVVAPGADPRAIRLAVKGAEQSEVNAQGDLQLASAGYTAVFHQPVIYQFNGSARQSVVGAYLLSAASNARAAREVRFRLGAYDRARPLVIDPSLTYSTYLGGTADDYAYGVAVDSSKNAYVNGETYSTNFPTETPEQGTCGTTTSPCDEGSGLADSFVAKINPAGSALVYSTFLGGSGLDIGTGIAVDAAGDAYVIGDTASTDFPTTSGVFQSTGNFFGDAYVAELNPAGSKLVYSSYFGGTEGAVVGANESTSGDGIAIDSSGNAFICGSTSSTNIPIAGALVSPSNGSTLAAGATANAYVAKIAAGGAKVLLSTYLGGSSNDVAYAVALDPNGFPFVAGETTSNNFPLLTAFQSSYDGQGDAFVTKLIFPATGNITLGYSTYLGGTSSDQAYGIAVDSMGAAYVTGSTSSTDFPVANAFQPGLAGGSSSDAFVTKLNPAGSGLVYSTYLGGTGADTGRGIAVDSAGIAHVVGYTSSTNFPTSNPIQATYNGNQDAFLTRLNPAGCGLMFSTYLGGKSSDYANAVAVDTAGDSYVAGYTGSNDFPTQAPLQSKNAGNNDVFVAVVPATTAGSGCFSPASLTFAAEAAKTTSAAQNITLTNSGNGDLAIASIVASGPFAETNTCGSTVAAAANCSISVTFSPTQAGQLAGQVTITDNEGGATAATQTINLTGIGTDFGMQITPASGSVSAGGSQTYTVTITPTQSFADSVALTCNGTPPAATCTVAPASVTPTNNSNVTATVTLATKSMAPPLSRRLPPWSGLMMLSGLGLLALARWARRAALAQVWRQALIGVALGLLVMAWIGCGVSNSTPTVTPPGSYTISVTGTDGALAHSVSAGLTVQ